MSQNEPWSEKTRTRITLVSGARISQGERKRESLYSLRCVITCIFNALALHNIGHILFSITIHKVRLRAAVKTIKQGPCLFNSLILINRTGKIGGWFFFYQLTLLFVITMRLLVQICLQSLSWIRSCVSSAGPQRMRRHTADRAPNAHTPMSSTVCVLLRIQNTF